MDMYGVTTRKHGIRFDRIKLILPANRTILLEVPLHARMVVLHALRKAALARGAVKKILTPPHTTYSAIVAVVVLALNPVIKERAPCARIFPWKWQGGSQLGYQRRRDGSVEGQQRLRGCDKRQADAYLINPYQK